MLDQSAYDSLFITLLEVVFSHELGEVDEGHVGARAQVLAEDGLSRALGSNKEGDLGEDSLAGLGVNCINFSFSANFSDLTELPVHIKDGHSLVLEDVDSVL